MWTRKPDCEGARARTHTHTHARTPDTWEYVSMSRALAGSHKVYTGSSFLLSTP